MSEHIHRQTRVRRPATAPLILTVLSSASTNAQTQSSSTSFAHEDIPNPLLCYVFPSDWEAIVVSIFWAYLVLQVSGFCAVRKWVVPRQQFTSGFCGCCTKSGPDQGRPWCSCLFATCCPCFQWFRVIAFLYECPRTPCGTCCSVFGCLFFTGCCLVNPFGLGCFTATSCLFGNCKNAWTRYLIIGRVPKSFYCTFLVHHDVIDRRSRYKIRQRLKIEGKMWEDCLIHCFVGLVRTKRLYLCIALLYMPVLEGT